MGEERRRFGVIPDRSAVLIEARSNVGPIGFGSMAIDGYVEAVIDGDAVDTDSSPSAMLSIALNTLRSGNGLYDAELLRRVDARNHPMTRVELRDAARIGTSERYQVSGELTFHGITRIIAGTVAVSLPDSKTIRIEGDHAFDIRDFDIAAPSVLMLRIYPDVRVQLQLEGQLSETDGEGH
jgi:polyisoprenoid-binding protein YceI